MIINQYKALKRKEYFCVEFVFSEVQSVEIAWVDSLFCGPIIYDCSFDDAICESTGMNQTCPKNILSTKHNDVPSLYP